MICQRFFYNDSVKNLQSKSKNQVLSKQRVICITLEKRLKDERKFIQSVQKCSTSI
jgi:hypothetical protein